jgi:hypothetical protein
LAGVETFSKTVDIGFLFAAHYANSIPAPGKS